MVNRRRKKFAAAVTLVEVMAAAAVLVVVIIGASAYRYHAALQEKRAAMQMTSSQFASLLCESWRGAGSTEMYDPRTALGASLPLKKVRASRDAAPDGFTILGRYVANIDDVAYNALLSWRNATPSLRELNVVVGWSQLNPGTPDPDKVDKLYKLTTYVSR